MEEMTQCRIQTISRVETQVGAEKHERKFLDRAELERATVLKEL